MHVYTSVGLEKNRKDGIPAPVLMACKISFNVGQRLISFLKVTAENAFLPYRIVHNPAGIEYLQFWTKLVEKKSENPLS